MKGIQKIRTQFFMRCNCHKIELNSIQIIVSELKLIIQTVNVVIVNTSQSFIKSKSKMIKKPTGFAFLLTFSVLPSIE